MVASYKIDLFHLFFEQGIKLLKYGGLLSYITPNTYLTNKYIKPLRKFILENCQIKKIINHDKVFTSASVDTATIIMIKQQTADNEVEILKSSEFEFTPICVKNQKDWYNDVENIININDSEFIHQINCKKLGDICKTYFGIQAYDRKKSISDEKLNSKYLPMIDGADIHSYTYAVPKIYFNYIPNNIKSGGDWKVYSQERIVIRQIGQIPIVGMCKPDILASNTLYSVYISDNNYNLKFILACLNSKFIQIYWQGKYSDNKALFPKIKGYQLKELPIPNATSSEQQEISKLVDAIITAKQNGDEKKAQEISDEIDERVAYLYERV